MLNVTPNTAGGGIWMSGGAPSVDSNGHLYVITGNGQFDGANSAPNDDYGDSFLQLAPKAGQNGLGVSSFFTPSDQGTDYDNDQDFGSGGSALVLNLTSGTSPQHLVVGGGKDGALYVLNGDQMGGSGDAMRGRCSLWAGAIFATAAFWNNTLYIAPVGTALLAYNFDSATLRFNSTAASASANTYGFPGATPSVSATGTSSNGIVWGIDSSNYCTPQSGGCGPALLHAYSRHGARQRAVEQLARRCGCGRQRRQVHRADRRQRQGLHRHARQQHRRGLPVHVRVGRAGCLRTETELTAQRSGEEGCGASGGTGAAPTITAPHSSTA